MRNLSEALALRAQGCSVIAAHAPGMPLPPGRMEADVGKFPLMPWKQFQRRSATEQEIQSWLQQRLSLNGQPVAEDDNYRCPF